MAGVNPDHATEDLFKAIENKDYPSWNVFVQIMTPGQAKDYKFDPFDVKKVLNFKYIIYYLINMIIIIN